MSSHLSEIERAEMQEVFNVIDKNKVGVIKKSDIIDLFETLKLPTKSEGKIFILYSYSLLILTSTILL